jgi:acetyl-CoA carboxylase alpha subunit
MDQFMLKLKELADHKDYWGDWEYYQQAYDRIEELEKTIARFVSELEYMSSEMSKVNNLKEKITKLEKRIDYLKEREERAWDKCAEAQHSRTVTRDAAMEAIRLLQIENEHLQNKTGEPKE